MLEIIAVIASVVSSTGSLGFAIHRWWQHQKDRKAQQAAFQVSQPTANAAKNLNSLLGVQEAYWRSNPTMWKVLGADSASY
jgi:hypothetical protein